MRVSCVYSVRHDIMASFSLVLLHALFLPSFSSSTPTVSSAEMLFIPTFTWHCYGNFYQHVFTFFFSDFKSSFLAAFFARPQPGTSYLEGQADLNSLGFGLGFNHFLLVFGFPSLFSLPLSLSLSLSLAREWAPATACER